MSAASPSNGQKGNPSPEAIKALEALRSYIEGVGGKLEDGWKIERKARAGGSGHAAAEGDPKKAKSPQQGHVDTYFLSPKGVKFRSKIEVARYLGLVEKKEKTSGASKEGQKAAAKKASSGTTSSMGSSKPSSGAGQKSITAYLSGPGAGTGAGAGASKPSSDPSKKVTSKPLEGSKPPVTAPPPPPPFIPAPLVPAHVDDSSLPNIPPPAPQPLPSLLSPLLNSEDVNQLMQVYEMLESLGSDLGLHKTIKGVANQLKGQTGSYQAPSLVDLAAMVTLSPLASSDDSGANSGEGGLRVHDESSRQALIQALDRIHCFLAMALPGEVLESLGEWLQKDHSTLSINK